MRKITKLAVEAFYNRSVFNKDNTMVSTGLKDGSTRFYLHGHCIAVLYPQGIIEVSSCKWFTKTTKERLNGILSKLGLQIYQRDFKWYVFNSSNNEVIDFKDGMEIIL